MEMAEKTPGCVCDCCWLQNTKMRKSLFCRDLFVCCLDRCVLEAAWKCPLALMVHNLIFKVSDNHMPKGCVCFFKWKYYWRKWVSAIGSCTGKDKWPFPLLILFCCLKLVDEGAGREPEGAMQSMDFVWQLSEIKAASECLKYFLF